jgi:EAL domain-containing protein (putative c-di-GMP-specific phosphodiesterase class I)
MLAGKIDSQSAVSEELLMLKAVRDWFASGKDDDVPSDAKVTLDDVLTRGWFELFYQPKIELGTRRLIGAEALVRARHPKRGLLPPSAFLPGADPQDMLRLTERVILAALRDWEDCAAVGAPHIKLAVNVPADAFVKLPIAQMIRETRPIAENWPGLVLEVTEEQAFNDLKMANEVAAELRAHHCSLAIDDFGAGYSSLGRLKQLPFSELKIDRVYIIDCHVDRMKGVMLESIIELAHRFGLKSIAEGIETSHEAHKLQGVGCQIGQGYLFAKPMAKDEFIAGISSRMGRPQPVPQRGFFAGLIPKFGTKA